MVREEKASGQRTWGRRCAFSLSGFQLSRGLRQRFWWSESHISIPGIFPNRHCWGPVKAQREQERRNPVVLIFMRDSPVHTQPHGDPSLVVLRHFLPRQRLWLSHSTPWW